MKLVFCTLFDSNYLDKGLAMYRSLNEVCEDFVLYILAMDKRCENILKAYQYPNLSIINLEEFIGQMKLQEAEKNRSRGEFCWTCSSHLIDFVISVCNESLCTYVDADLFFYKDPKCLIDEMGEKTVQIVEHRFKNDMGGRVKLRKSGRYCVEFNTFKNEKKAMKLLRWWEGQCIKNCSIHNKKSKVFGDQAYLNGWEKYDYVSIINNPGGGVAPWNIDQYIMKNNKNQYMLEQRKNKEEFELVFYHFHNISYISNKKIDISVYQRAWNIDEQLVNNLYLPYLKKLDDIKDEIDSRFGFYPILYSHPELEGVNKRTIRGKDVIKKIVGKGVDEIWVSVNDVILNRFKGKKNIINI